MNSEHEDHLEDEFRLDDEDATNDDDADDNDDDDDDDSIDDLLSLDSDDDDDDDDDNEEESSTPIEELSDELLAMARQMKATRLYVEENGRYPHSRAELSHFIMSPDCETPIEPEEEDIEKARKKLEG